MPVPTMTRNTTSPLLTGLAIFGATLAAGYLAMAYSGRLSTGVPSLATVGVAGGDRGPRSGPLVLSDLLDKEKNRLACYASGSLQERLEDWTDEEVATAFRESIKSPAGCFASEAGDSISNLLYVEWVRRDFDGALEWFQSEPSRSLKGGLVYYLSKAWPAERSEEGLAFATANPDLFPINRVWPLFGTILTSRAAQGPQAVEDFFRDLRQSGIEPRFALSVSIPDGFDFRALSESPEFSELCQSRNADAIIRAWSDQDPDGVFDWMLDDHGPAALRTLISSAAGTPAEKIRWMGGKMVELSPEQRQEFYGSMLGRWVQIPYDMQQFMGGLKDPGLQDEVDRLSLQMIYAGNGRGAFLFLDAIEDPARRIELLETAEPHRLFTEAPYFRGYGPSTEHKLVEKLKAWNATPDQIRTIVDRFKK
ncbi:MAG: hypothetical protein EOP85_03995 [Verrucomicrobiaceae bacterium]|nr:MAG: hypothetical protein EOP85_03995 [Verrucomicrobiaceae bacterium]